MAEMDRKTIEEIGIPGMVLMENAGRKVVAESMHLLGSVAGKKVLIFCGKGNNGGDGFVVARHLHEMGAQAEVFLIGEHDAVKGDAAAYLNILELAGVKVLPCLNWEHNQADLGAQLVVDAMLGTGAKGPLRGVYASIVDWLNGNAIPTIAIDLPTGMDSDTGAVAGACVFANVTVTMGQIKRGLLFSPGREHAGKVVVADIGIPAVVSEKSGVKCFQLSDRYIQSVLPRRRPDVFKNRCGQVILLAGSVGLTGAAALSAEVTLRVGTGMAILGIPKSLNAILEQKLTEVMSLPLPETDCQSLSFDARKEIAEKLPWADVLALGPGLTTHDETTRLVKWLLEKTDKPMVLDADAINCLAGQAKFLSRAKGQLILTPHPGELARLIGTTVKEILANPMEVARAAAQKLSVVLVLKGAPTVVASPDGFVFVNATGNPGMATAGMGDVLTGVIAGLAAQGLSPLNAALAGVFVHGMAGDFARAKLGEAGLIAGDVLNELPLVLKEFEEKSQGADFY